MPRPEFGLKSGNSSEMLRSSVACTCGITCPTEQPALRAGRALGTQAPDQFTELHEFRERGRFPKILSSTQVERAAAIVGGIGRADHYDGDSPVARTFPEALQHFVAGFAGHVHIQHQDVGSRVTSPGV